MAVLRELTVACRAAQVAMPVTFYTLRHTYASHLIQQSTPMLYVASALGHRDARMVEKHYAHLAPSHVAATIRANLPTFGSVAAADTNKRQPARRARESEIILRRPAQDPNLGKIIGKNRVS
jgi:hypothetical protein